MTQREQSDRIFLWPRFAITPGYAVLAVIVLVALSIQVMQFHFSTDLWMHVPAIVEFSVNPLAPNHIYIIDPLPYHTLNAYHFVLGLFSRMTGVTPLVVAQLAGVANLTILLLLFPQFVSTFVRHAAAPSIALLLTLLAWGPNSWRYSAFLNLNSIGFGAPYPSYFALWVLFLTVWTLRRHRERPQSRWQTLGLLAVGGFLVANSHPITFGGLLIFGVALTVERGSRQVVTGLAAIILGAAVGSAIWPFFDVYDATSNSLWMDVENLSMYQNTAVRVAPALLGLPLLARRFRKNTRDPLVIAFVLCVLVYLGGLLADRATYGRILPFGVLALHLVLAEYLAPMITEASGMKRALSISLVAGLVCLGVVFSLPAVVRMVPRQLLPANLQTDPRLDTDRTWLTRAASVISYGDVVLAPPDISTQFASIGAKPVTFRRVNEIPDQPKRQSDVVAFFQDPNTEILDFYEVDWIAFQPMDVSASTRRAIEGLGVAEEFDGLVLVEVINPDSR